MNRSRQILARAGMAMDGGAPRCGVCEKLLQFDTDHQGRTMEVCTCGYRGYLETRLPRNANGAARSRTAPLDAQR